MNILILDDHRMFADGVEKMLLDDFPNSKIKIFQSIAHIKDSEELSSAEFLVSDIELPNENIFEFFDFIKSNYKDLKVLVVSMHNKLSVIKKCIDLGVDGYVLKDDLIDFKEVIPVVLSGEKYFSSKVNETYEILKNPNSQNLSPREEEILESLSKGISIDEIAEKLFLSSLTVKTHIRNIKQKLNFSRTSELIVYYFKNYIN